LFAKGFMGLSLNFVKAIAFLYYLFILLHHIRYFFELET